jgi:beta-glucanase (GH16 family)
MSRNMRARLVLVFASMFLSVSAAVADNIDANDALPPAPANKTWKLIWHDEFDGTVLDARKWDVPEYQRRDGYWSRKAVALDGKGHLVMSTLKEGDRYLDGCVRTHGKFAHSFGYYVARIQLQQQPGHWSAFWIMGSGVGKVGDGGRDGTEIDIMEKPWLDERINCALHWDGYGKDHKSASKVVKAPGVMQGWHTFGLWWKPDEYIFYVDGQEKWRTNAGGVCQAPEYLKLSDEIGSWGGDIKQAKLPDAFLVDYVRVFDLVPQPKAAARKH